MKEVKVYGLSTCPWCRKAKEYFEKQSVLFSYIDYDLSSSEEQERISQEMSSFQLKGFPVVKVGEEAVVGYSQEVYSELIKSSSSLSSLSAKESR
ncbi:MAG: glutaredoxin family protein [Syntrophorhabdales bacterium]|jgi:glutaredoxin